MFLQLATCISPNDITVHPAEKKPQQTKCPANSHLSNNGAACDCNEGFQPNSDGTNCVEARAPPQQQCPPNSFSSGSGQCQCSPGFSVSADGASCTKTPAPSRAPFIPHMHVCCTPCTFSPASFCSPVVPSQQPRHQRWQGLRVRGWVSAIRGW